MIHQLPAAARAARDAGLAICGDDPRSYDDRDHADQRQAQREYVDSARIGGTSSLVAGIASRAS